MVSSSSTSATSPCLSQHNQVSLNQGVAQPSRASKWMLSAAEDPWGSRQQQGATSVHRTHLGGVV
jgi:hypothetical protein